MGKETVLFKIEEKRDVDGVVEFLRQLADKLEERQVTLKQGKKKVVLELPERVELEVKAEKEVGKKRVKKKLELEIEWVVGEGKKKKERGVFELG